MRTPLLLLSGLVGAALAGSAGAAVRDFPARGFDRIEAGGTADVTVRTGPGFAVHADGDPDAVDALTVAVRGDTLVIGMKPGIHLRRGRLTVAVTAPRIAGVRGSGTGTIAIDRVAGPAFAADMAGTGTLRLPAIQVGQLHVTMSGTGSAQLAGRAERVDLSLSGTGGIDAAGLVARGGRIDASGVGRVTAQVDGPVDVQVGGIASVTVTGHPACTIHKSGVGSVRCA